jgi:hypothetical protein
MPFDPCYPAGPEVVAARESVLAVLDPALSNAFSSLSLQQRAELMALLVGELSRRTLGALFLMSASIELNMTRERA